jgi:multisubunit Na+/H+ antiporter MnhB subunit
MKFGAIFGITLIVIVMILFEWPKFTKKMKKEKRAFLILTVVGWILAILLLYFPEMPGPTQLVDFVYKPLGKLLE